MTGNRDTYTVTLTVKVPHGTPADSVREAAELDAIAAEEASADWLVTVHSVVKGAPAPKRKRKSDRRVIVRVADGHGGPAGRPHRGDPDRAMLGRVTGQGQAGGAGIRPRRGRGRRA